MFADALKNRTLELSYGVDKEPIGVELRVRSMETRGELDDTCKMVKQLAKTVLECSPLAAKNIIVKRWLQHDKNVPIVIKHIETIYRCIIQVVGDPNKKSASGQAFGMPHIAYVYT